MGIIYYLLNKRLYLWRIKLHLMGCLECGKKLIQTPGKRAKQFCNTTCRSNYWQKKKRQEAGRGGRKYGRPAKEHTKKQATSRMPVKPIIFIDAAEIPTTTYLRGDVSFQDLLTAAKDPVSDKGQIQQLTKNHKKLTPGQKDMIYSKLKK